MTRTVNGSTTHADKRRQSLIEAAYQSIAQEGLKGLRTRDVAAWAGITHATLHYYFPTKEALIEAVADYAVFQGLLVDIPRGNQEDAPGARLHQFLMTLQHNLREEPTHFLVLYELARYARQCPTIREIFQRQTFHPSWHRFLASLLDEGIRQGAFRADLNPEDGASIVMTFILGLGMSLLVPVPGDPEQMIQQLEQWLMG